MWIGWIEFDLRLGDVRSLKAKRSVVRPIIAEIRRKFELSAAETAHVDALGRAGIGAAVVSADSAHVVSVLDKVESLVAERPEVELLSAGRRMRTSGDEDWHSNVPFDLQFD